MRDTAFFFFFFSIVGQASLLLSNSHSCPSKAPSQLLRVTAVLPAQFIEEGASTVTEEKAQLSVSTKKVIELSQFHGSRQD